MNVLSVIWFGAAIAGALAALIAIFVQRLRQPALLAAGFSFALAGVLGIFSIGILFVGLAAFCFSRISSAPQTGFAVPPAPPPPMWPPSAQ